MADLQLKFPYVPVNIAQILSIAPSEVISENQITQLKPLLSQLLFGDFAHVEPHYFQQLLHILQLIQLAAQYFAQAQDQYAEQLERTSGQLTQLKQENLSLKQRVGVLEERILAEKELVSSEALEAKRENENLKCQLFELKCEVKNLRRQAETAAEMTESLPVCEFCGKRFSDVEFLAKHVERRHFGVFQLWCAQQLDGCAIRQEGGEGGANKPDSNPKGCDGAAPDSMLNISRVEPPRVPDQRATGAQEVQGRRSAQNPLQTSPYNALQSFNQSTAQNAPQTATAHEQCPGITVDMRDVRLLQQCEEFLRSTQQYESEPKEQERSIALSPPDRVEKPVLLESAHAAPAPAALSEQAHDGGPFLTVDDANEQQIDVESFQTVSENAYVPKNLSECMRRVH